MNWTLLLVCSSVLLGAATAQDGDWELVWEDNFDTLDESKWDWEITAWGGGVSTCGFSFFTCVAI